jgi:hypothetical protein
MKQIITSDRDNKGKNYTIELLISLVSYSFDYLLVFLPLFALYLFIRRFHDNKQVTAVCKKYF